MFHRMVKKSMNHLIRQNDINEMIKYSLIDNICQMDTSI